MDEKAPATLPPIKITITREDFEDISNALKSIPLADRQKIGDAIRDQDFQILTPAEKDFIGVVAAFAKLTAERKDRELIKSTLSLDDPDLAFLIAEADAFNGIQSPLSYLSKNEPPNETAEEQAEPAEVAAIKEETIQPELFPDLKPDTPPTLAVDYDEQHIHSDKANVSISKASQKMTAILNREVTPIIVSSPKSKKPIVTKVTLSLDDLPDGTQIARPISYYDRIVEDAIGNLFDQGFTKITPEMVYRQINGLTDARKVSQQAAAKVDRSIRRLARTWITIDFTEQLQALVRDKLTKGTIGDVILPAKNVYLRFADGTIKSGWQIKELPQIYHYSKIVKQIATVPTAILDTTQATRSTDEMIAARYYLITQIERIKRKPDNTKILFDTLFDAIGDPAALESREIRRRRILAISALLEHFKQARYIQDFTITKARGGKIDGVCITVPPAKKAIEQ